MTAPALLSSVETRPHGGRPETASSEGYRLDIQGLRAIAVLSVVIYHGFPQLLPGGFVGVDVFFVISGFLITGILYRDMQSGRFSMAGFYRRRIRRIFPALFLVLVAVIGLGYLLLSPQDFFDLSRNVVSATLFVSNIDFFLSSGYFDRAAELRPLLHTWSLAVEEQFYIFFPPLMWLVLRYARAVLVPLIVVSILGGALLSEWALGTSATGAYFLTPFRVYELLIGSFLAVISVPRALQSAMLRSVITVVGLVLIGGSVLAIHKGLPFPGFLALPPVLGTALVILAGRAGPSRGSALISSAPFVFFGAISYSLYLWHWPLLSFLRISSQPETPGVGITLVVLGLAVLLAWLSYRFVEQRIAHKPVTQLPFLRWGAAGMTAMILLAGTVLLLQGLPGRFPEGSQRMFASAKDFSPLRTSCHREGDNLQMTYEDTCIIGARDTAPSLAIWGDSHGVELAKAMGDEFEKSGRALRQITASACPPVLGVVFDNRPGCLVANDAIISALEADTEIATVVLLANAVSYFKRQPAEPLIAGYRDTVTRLLATGKRVVLVSQLPNIEMEAPAVAGYALFHGKDPAVIGRSRADVEKELTVWRETLQTLASSDARISFYDPLQDICGDILCPVVDEQQNVLYFNPTHVSLAGARHVVLGLQEAL